MMLMGSESDCDYWTQLQEAPKKFVTSQEREHASHNSIKIDNVF
jgi:hypothetical protein